MQSFIDEFLAENCRGEALLAERLNRFVTFRQLALMASSGCEARAGASGQDGVDLSSAAGADEEVRFYYASAIGTDDDKAWFRKLAPHATNDVRVLLCDSKCQDRELCGKRKFRHLGAFRKGQTNR